MKLIILFITLFAFSLVFVPTQTECECQTTQTDEETHWAGNQWIVNKEEKPYKKVRGTVKARFNDEFLPDTLVEIFDNPSYLLCEFEPNNHNKCTTNSPDEQKRIAATKTDEDGKFCFEDIPSGKYELRISRAPDWNVVHIYLEVDLRKGISKKRGVIVEMSVGD